MKRLVYLFLLFVACDQVVEQTQKLSEIVAPAEGVSIAETAEINKSDEQCNGDNCTEVSISFPVFKSALALNNRVNSEIVSVLQDFVQARNPPSNLDDLCDMFISDYQEIKASFPESTPWFLSIDASTNYNREYLISIELSNEAYTGGAHANRELTYLNVSREGRVIEVGNLIDLQVLTTRAEELFRIEKGLSAAADLADAGFSFNENAFHLPENIGFGEKGVLVYFNSYEISSYADGPTELVIPYEDLGTALKFAP